MLLLGPQITHSVNYLNKPRLLFLRTLFSIFTGGAVGGVSIQKHLLMVSDDLSKPHTSRVICVIGTGSVLRFKARP